MPRKKSQIKTRDLLMVAVINGVTKAGTHKDKKKEENKRLARKKVKTDD